MAISGDQIAALGSAANLALILVLAAGGGAGLRITVDNQFPSMILISSQLGDGLGFDGSLASSIGSDGRSIIGNGSLADFAEAADQAFLGAGGLLADQPVSTLQVMAGSSDHFAATTGITHRATLQSGAARGGAAGSLSGGHLIPGMGSQRQHDLVGYFGAARVLAATGVVALLGASGVNMFIIGVIPLVSSLGNFLGPVVAALLAVIANQTGLIASSGDDGRSGDVAILVNHLNGRGAVGHSHMIVTATGVCHRVDAQARQQRDQQRDNQKFRVFHG
ncbi:MAG: hypothetical protein IJ664_01450 [Clostridia bacterium]|nr:hypothetical protein [Clostridia bacterium]